MSDIHAIIDSFAIEGAVRSVKEFGAGHINRTFLADCGEKQYVIQQINTTVFRDPDALMRNVFAVTDYLREQIRSTGGDWERGTLNFIRTKDGKPYCRMTDGGCYRAYLFVPDSVSYNAADTPELFGKSGAAFGSFLRRLSDFPADTLTETIPHFHDSAWRYENEFLPAVARADKPVTEPCRAEIDFVQQHHDLFDVLTPFMASGELPLRVTHNDTKLNNLLFDSRTGECLCVIDLDTIMPGLALYDFGDSIRFGASTGKEDAPDPDKVKLDLDYFRAYAENYLHEAGKALTDCERRFLPHAAVQITLECGMRFLTDYLSGNTYFRIDYPQHNLVRARNQFALAADMLAKQDAMTAIIDAIR